MENRYRTSDFGIAALLMTVGIPFLGLDQSNPRRSTFEFQDSPDVSQHVQGWFAGTAMVSARHFLESEKNLRNMVISHRVGGQ